MSEPRDGRPLPPRRELPPRPRAVAADDGPAVAPTALRLGADARPSQHRAPVARPDARPMRMLIGLTGVAAMSALATAVAVPPAAGQATTTVVEAQVEPSVAVTHVTRFVQLKPGQTAPPNAPVKAAPAATPRVVVVTTTRQSGKP